MEVFTDTIEELVSEDFTIQANSKEEALEKAIQLYKQGDLVLCPGNLEAKRIHIATDCCDDWIEF